MGKRLELRTISELVVLEEILRSLLKEYSYLTVDTLHDMVLDVLPDEIKEVLSK